MNVYVMLVIFMLCVVDSTDTWALDVQGITLGTTTVGEASKMSQFSLGITGCKYDSCILKGTVGSFPVQLFVYSPKSVSGGVIHSVTISASENRYDKFKEALSAKYGPPTSETKVSDTSSRGMKFERMVATWELPDGKIVLDERTPVSVLGYTQVEYKTLSYAIEAEREATERKEKLKQGL